MDADAIMTCDDDDDDDGCRLAKEGVKPPTRW